MKETKLQIFYYPWWCLPPRLAVLLTVALLFQTSGGHPTGSFQQKDDDDDITRQSHYLIGTGIYDITGPAAQINFMGYAKPSQTARGIHLRLRSRAYIIAESSLENSRDGNDDDGYYTEEEEEEGDTLTSLRRRRQTSNDHESNNSENMMDNRRTQEENQKRGLNPEKTICFVSIDTGMGSDLLTSKVIQRLEELLPTIPGQTKKLCHLENTSISGTHTHSAPAGFLQYSLFQITSLGFSPEVFNTYVEGIALSLKRAYDKMNPGSIYMANGLLNDANINRSPTSYLENPSEERAMYAEEGNTDKNMLLLKFSQHSSEADETVIGALNWFSVHGTSMNSTNGLISGDNKGYASYLMEKQFNPEGTQPGKGDFVAAFASTNLGDVSPNTDGPKCTDTGLPCDILHSTCDGGICVASGPGIDMFESTEIIGRKQFDHAMGLMSSATDILKGGIAYRQVFVDMSNKSVILQDGTVGKTCPAALGYSFGAGTTDGAGDFDFTQGTNSSNPFWNTVSGFLSTPSEEEQACQDPKPILLNTGNVDQPYQWDPNTLPISIFKVGQLLILNVPAEFTTMAGRRLKRAVAKVASEHGMKESTVTIAGLANSYSHYVATFEEYKKQRYEAASTLYGPHTLSAYIQEFERITIDLLEGNQSLSDDAPLDLSKKQLSFLPPVIVDTVAFRKKFGDVKEDADDEYIAGQDVQVSFHSANPRNNQRIEDTFLSVDKLREDGSWDTKYVDGDWCTQYEWKGNTYVGRFIAKIKWSIPEFVEEGTYRICHFGTHKTLINSDEKDVHDIQDTSVERKHASQRRLRYKDFQGCSRSFEVNHK